MNKRSLGALVVLNLVLLAAVLVVSLTPTPVSAQGLGGRGGNFVMIAGQVKGREQQAGIYILDLNRAIIHWVFYNSNNQRLDHVASREIAPDLDAIRQQR